MNAHIAIAHDAAPSIPANTAAILAAARDAADRIAPLWPLDSFVAVNPFLGMTDLAFADAINEMARRAGARMTPPRAVYRDAFAAGRFDRSDLAAALQAAGGPAAGSLTVEALVRSLSEDEPAAPEPLPTIASLATKLGGTDWQTAMTDQVSRFAAAWFDQGQAAWRAPFSGLGLWTAFKAQASADRTAEILGLKGFRAHVSTLPEAHDAALVDLAARLGLSDQRLSIYFHRLLMVLPGWAGYARHKVWTARLGGGDDSVLAELLAILLAYETAILVGHPQSGRLQASWARAADRFDRLPGDAGKVGPAIAPILQGAFERGLQRDLGRRLAASAQSRPDLAGRPALQAVFCIDVRSEVFRRALEVVVPGALTIGFAGFFGFAMAHKAFGASTAKALCPVLLKPKMIICDEVTAAAGTDEATLASRRTRAGRLASSWSAFRQSAVSSFGFIEAAGLAGLAKLVTDSLRGGSGAANRNDIALRPTLKTAEADGTLTGIDPQTRLAMADAVLKAMSLHEPYARIVLLAGHGSTSANNPHAAGLDCGACGGHAGDVNARVAAAVLNDPDVRAGLRARHIALPDDTIFVAALHDTTTDEVELFDLDDVPSSHATDLAALTTALAEAGKLCRAERSAKLAGARDAAGTARDSAILARAADWSQIRPEWGLAGCAAFIAAPRHRTAAADLGGRAFLHSYDHRRDDGHGILELIMTAPMVVASWINLQYYGSTVDNRVFGSGNKVLHNVAGLIGVFEGHSGDLRPGLAWQSVHDGERLMHEPVRLNVIIEAPLDAINGVVAKHAGIAQLLDNGWVNLFALDEAGVMAWRYAGNLTWERFDEITLERSAA